MTSQLVGEIRTNATDYYIAWQAYIHAIIEATAPNQITNGGPVIGMLPSYTSGLIFLTA